MKANVICLQILENGIIIGVRKSTIIYPVDKIVPIGEVTMSEIELKKINNNPLDHIGNVLIVDYDIKTDSRLIDTTFVEWSENIGQHECRFEDIFK